MIAQLRTASLALAAAGGVTIGAAFGHARHYVVHQRVLSSVLAGGADAGNGAPAGSADTGVLTGSAATGMLASPAAAPADAPDTRAAMAGGGAFPRAPHTALRILHLSDMHAIRANWKLFRFLSGLAAVQADLIVITGDFIASAQGIDPLLRALAPLQGTPGLFVYGSNDYYAARFKNPLSYLVRNSNAGPSAPTAAQLARRQLPTEMLTQRLAELGFVNLNNARAQLTINGVTIKAVGVNDPHLDMDRYPAHPATSAPASRQRELRIGVTHAPYKRVLNEMTAEGCQLIFAGHTHGGQVCLPGGRALVTNCDLPPRLASGLFPWPDTGAQSLHGDGHSAAAAPAQVQVSAGLGTTPFVPLRTFCAPEALILDVL